MSGPSLGVLPTSHPAQPDHSQATESSCEMEGIGRHKTEATLHDGAGEVWENSEPLPSLPIPAPSPQC
jgi:hypothetical protein